MFDLCVARRRNRSRCHLRSTAGDDFFSVGADEFVQHGSFRRGGGLDRRLPPPAPQGKNSAFGASSSEPRPLRAITTNSRPLSRLGCHIAERNSERRGG